MANQPRALWLRAGLEAELCTRGKLGRPLAAAHAYGCKLFVEERARAGCPPAGRDLRFHQLATTRLARTGDYSPARDEPALCMPHGSSPDHRPDLQPAGLARRGSQAGGIPWLRQRWDGPTADPRLVPERAE